MNRDIPSGDMREYWDDGRGTDDCQGPLPPQAPEELRRERLRLTIENACLRAGAPGLATRARFARICEDFFLSSPGSATTTDDLAASLGADRTIVEEIVRRVRAIPGQSINRTDT